MHLIANLVILLSVNDAIKLSAISFIFVQRSEILMILLSVRLVQLIRFKISRSRQEFVNISILLSVILIQWANPNSVSNGVLASDLIPSSVISKHLIMKRTLRRGQLAVIERIAVSVKWMHSLRYIFVNSLHPSNDHNNNDDDSYNDNNNNDNNDDGYNDSDEDNHKGITCNSFNTIIIKIINIITIKFS